MKTINVLHIINGPSGAIGGVERFLLTQYSLMDHSEIHFDFAFTRANTMKLIENEPALAGCRFYATHALDEKRRLKKITRFYGSLVRIIRENGYDVVHINSGSIVLEAIAVAAARRCGVRCIIAHSHNANSISQDGTMPPASLPVRMLRRYVARRAAHLLACSQAAGVSMLGAETARPNYQAITHGIPYRSFLYDEETRRACRAEHGAEEKTVFLAVGRLSPQKNPLFMLGVFAAVRSRIPNAVLWVLGNGELRGQVEEKLRALHLEDSVTLFGERTDVPRMMQGADCLLFPSVLEGLSAVTIEAQTAGLPIFASDSISSEHKITDLVTFLPLSLGEDAWGENIARVLPSLPPRRDMTDEIVRAGYDAAQTAHFLETLYRNAAAN